MDRFFRFGLLLTPFVAVLFFTLPANSAQPKAQQMTCTSIPNWINQPWCGTCWLTVCNQQCIGQPNKPIGNGCVAKCVKRSPC